MSRPFRHLFGLLFLLSACFIVQEADAAEFRSVSPPSATLYDSYSLEAKPLFTIKRYTPVEVLIELGSWVKVREPEGEIAWIESKNLSSQRTVIVTAAQATIYKDPDEKSPVVFQAERSVPLERLGIPRPGWVAVKHLDGETGNIRIQNIWGE